MTLKDFFHSEKQSDFKSKVQTAQNTDTKSDPHNLSTHEQKQHIARCISALKITIWADGTDTMLHKYQILGMHPIKVSSQDIASQRRLLGFALHPDRIARLYPDEVCQFAEDLLRQLNAMLDAVQEDINGTAGACEQRLIAEETSHGPVAPTTVLSSSESDKCIKGDSSASTVLPSSEADKCMLIDLSASDHHDLDDDTASDHFDIYDEYSFTPKSQEADEHNSNEDFLLSAPVRKSECRYTHDLAVLHHSLRSAPVHESEYKRWRLVSTATYRWMPDVESLCLEWRAERPNEG